MCSFSPLYAEYERELNIKWNTSIQYIGKLIGLVTTMGLSDCDPIMQSIFH